jgi:hypothetical protein
MKLYYTGAPDFLQEQENPLQSLGGYISKSPVKNGGVASIFGSISQKLLREGGKEYRIVALKNETESSKAITLYYSNLSKDPVSSFKMGLVAPATDDCEGLYVEKIASIYNKPVSGSFADNRGEANALRFSIEPQQFIGIWIERSINKFKGSQILSCEKMIAEFNTEDVNQEIEVSIQDSDVIGTYWTFNTVDSRVYVWYDDESNPSVVQVADREGIRVKVSSTDTEEQVAQKTLTVLQSIVEERGEATVTVQGTTLTIKQTQSGKVEEPNVGTSPIMLSQEQGQSSVQETLESLEITIDYL